MAISAHLVEPARLQWRDGEPYSEQFDDIYYSRDDGLDESRYVFLANNGLPERWVGKLRFTIAELGFGTGLNFLLTADAWRRSRQPGQVLDFVSIERFPLNKDDFLKAASRWPALLPEAERLIRAYPPLVAGVHHCNLGDGIHLSLVYADVAEGLKEIDARVDAWFLDGFNPGENRAMWDEAVFRSMAQITKRGATAATFSVAGFVRRGLANAGFAWRKVKGHGRKREMLVAEFMQTPERQSFAPWFSRATPRFPPGKAIVVGSGIAGATSAHMLRHQGWDVTVVDAGDGIAQGASGTPAALVYPVINAQPSPYESFYLRAFGVAFHALTELGLGEDVWKPCGVDHHVDDEQYRRVLSRLDAEPGLREWVSPEAALKIHYPLAGSLRPARLCERLLRGCEFLGNWSFAALRNMETGVCLIDDQGEELLADVVVIAAGHDTRLLLDAERFPIRPLSGQAEEIDTQGVDVGEVPVIGDGYLVPIGQDTAVVGANFDPLDARLADRRVWRDENFRRMESLINDWDGSETRIRQSRPGTRATTPDRLPMIGPVIDSDAFIGTYDDLRHGRPEREYSTAPYRSGVFLNTGYGARGLVGAFLGAELLVREIEAQNWPIEKSLREFLLPQRFLVRNLRRGKLL